MLVGRYFTPIIIFRFRDSLAKYLRFKAQNVLRSSLTPLGMFLAKTGSWKSEQKSSSTFILLCRQFYLLYNAGRSIATRRFMTVPLIELLKTFVVSPMGVGEWG